MPEDGMDEFEMIAMQDWAARLRDLLIEAGLNDDNRVKTFTYIQNLAVLQD